VRLTDSRRKHRLRTPAKSHGSALSEVRPSLIHHGIPSNRHWASRWRRPADALELNLCDVVTDPKQASAQVERNVVKVAHELKRVVKIPIAVKLSPYFTAFAPLAQELDQAGADGLALFNRFYRPDFDIQSLTVAPHIELSGSSELLLRLQWLAIHGLAHAEQLECRRRPSPRLTVRAGRQGS
jgi:hypothetical protein